MKARSFVITIVSGLALLTACHTPTREARQMMAQAKALSDTAPDSAVKLIDSVLRMEYHFSEQQRMDLALLQGELVFRDASIDEEVPPEDVSTSPELERAGAYFAKRKEYTKAAHASLYSGYVQQAYGEREKAMRSYKDAEHYGVIVGDSLTMARAECKMGRMLFDDYMEKEALCQFQSAERNAGDNLNELSLIRNMAAASCLVLGLYDSADYYLKQSLVDAERCLSRNAKRKALNNYAVYHRILGEFDESIGCLHRMFNEVDSTLLPIVYLNLGRTYVSLANLDSAYYYYQQLERTLSDFWIKPETKASAYQALSEFAESQKNDSNALKYRKLYEKFIGVVRDQTAQKTVYRIQQRYDYEALQNAMSLRVIRRQRIILVLSVVLLLFVVALAYLQIRLAKNLKREADIKASLLRFAQANNELSAKSEEYDKQRHELEQKLSKARLKEQRIMQKMAVYLGSKEDAASLDSLKYSLMGNQEYWDAMLKLFDMQFPGTRKKLKQQHPELTEKEQKVLLLSYLDTSREDAAILLDTSVHMVDKLRNSVRKKMLKDTF
ncbi:MAG: hypothetical protein II862_02100 [Bacteroidales bacterium]|nr:hypothetical protein [Bacteroidales bacterium]